MKMIDEVEFVGGPWCGDRWTVDRALGEAKPGVDLGSLTASDYIEARTWTEEVVGRYVPIGRDTADGRAVYEFRRRNDSA